LRRCLSKFRTSCHDLEIERGRCKKLKLEESLFLQQQISRGWGPLPNSLSKIQKPVDDWSDWWHSFKQIVLFWFQVVVLIIICIVSLLVIYMLFLLCLDPLMNRRPKTYQEQQNEEVNLVIIFWHGTNSLIALTWTISAQKLHIFSIPWLVLLLGIFRRVPCPSATRGHPCALLLPRGALPFKKNFFNFYW
jgi:hypothetical protein